MRKATGSYRTYSIPGKTDALIPELAVEDLPSVDLLWSVQMLKRECVAESNGKLLHLFNPW